MKTIKDIKLYIADKISKYTKADISYKEIDNTPSPEYGDFSFPCFDLAMLLKKNPFEVSKELLEIFSKDTLFENIKSAGPYLNFFVKKRLFNKIVITNSIKNEKIKEKKEKIMIEYSQPNTHKEFHIGHLRNVCLGASLVNIYRRTGYKVIATNYINDLGKHVAICLWNYLKNYRKEKLPENKGKFLGKIYANGCQLIADNENYQKEVSVILQKLENNDPRIKKIWKKTRQWSLKQFKGIYKDLKVKFDKYIFESEILDEGKDIVNDLLNKNIAKKDNEAILVDLKKYNLDVFLLIKSDKTALYSVKDLALAFKKFKDFDIDESLYIVDVRQEFYFKQLFKVLELYGFNKKMKYIGYEIVTLLEGIMASRKGNVVLYEDLLNKILEKTNLETKRRHTDWSSEQIEKVSWKIALSAIKFDMLKYENNQVIVFDMDKAISLQGNTGPYLLYTYARIQSVLSKAKVDQIKTIKFNYTEYINNEEKLVISLLKNFDNILEEVALYNKPSLFCTYLIDLAKKFNHFYQKVQIIENNNIKQTSARLKLAQATAQILKKGLKLLNIDIVEKM